MKPGPTPLIKAKKKVFVKKYSDRISPKFNEKRFLHHVLLQPNEILDLFASNLNQIRTSCWFGRVHSIVGLLVEVKGINEYVQLGSVVSIHRDSQPPLLAEVVGFKENMTLVMGYGFLEGIKPRSKVVVLRAGLNIHPTSAWKGRVIDGLCNPIDNKGPLLQGTKPYFVKATPPPAHTRLRTKEPISLGVRAINTFATCCKGQRMGVFSATGVGKSILLGQITRFTQCDVIVVGLIGERGREVNEFIEDQLGPEGLKKAIVVVATSDMPALVRRQAAYVTLTLAEYFRDQKLNVLCVVDSMTRFALAQREIGLSIGEPPTTRGFPPTVFSELPRLLERAGNTDHEGSITGIFSVLVEGDDHNEPISDTTRGILDGHIVLDRNIAERGRYPAINILKSISRSMPARTIDEEALIQKAKKVVSVYEEMADMVHLGAYKKGQSPEIDEAVRLFPKVEDFLKQAKDDESHFEDGLLKLKKVFS